MVPAGLRCSIKSSCPYSDHHPYDPKGWKVSLSALENYSPHPLPEFKEGVPATYCYITTQHALCLGSRNGSHHLLAFTFLWVDKVPPGSSTDLTLGVLCHCYQSGLGGLESIGGLRRDGRRAGSLSPSPGGPRASPVSKANLRSQRSAGWPQHASSSTPSLLW